MNASTMSTGVLSPPMLERPEVRTFFTEEPGITVGSLLNQHTRWIRLPDTYIDHINRIQHLTNWSFRELADVLGTSHTTVGKIANGAQPTSRSKDTVDRLEPLLAVVSRIADALPADRQVAEVLMEAAGDGARPMDALMEGEWGRAYLQALDNINGPRPRRPNFRGPLVGRASATMELG